MISVVIPALNEGEGIGPTIDAVSRILQQNQLLPFEIVVVDDGSSDETAPVARNRGATVVSHAHNLGYGRSLKDGIVAASYDTIAIIDADGTYPAELLPTFIERYSKGYDLIVGRRQGVHYHESWLKRPLRAILKFLVEFTTGQSIPDINSGMRVFSRQTIIPYFDQLCNTFSFTTSQTLAYMLTGKFIGYIPIDYHDRIGQKKVKLFKDSLRTLQYIVQSVLYYNPFKLFLLISLGCSVVGLATCLVGFSAQLAILSLFGAGCILLSVLVFTLGLLSDQIRQILLKMQYRGVDGNIVRGHSVVNNLKKVANS